MAKPCAFAGCDKPSRAGGLCIGHYHQKLRGRELSALRQKNVPIRCSAAGCDKVQKARGLCSHHYHYPPHAPRCSFAGCPRPATSYNHLCVTHYHQQSRQQHLTPIRPRVATGVKIICSFAGCQGQVIAFGLCDSHYKQQRRGKPLRPIARHRTTTKK